MKFQLIAIGCIVLAIHSIASLLPAARAQVTLVDDIILITQGQKKQEQDRTTQHLGQAGSNDARLGPSPGAGAAALGEQSLPSTDRTTFSMRGRDVLSAAAAPPGPPSNSRTQVRIASAEPIVGAPPPIYGPLEIPANVEEGPANGLSLDAAIERLMRSNYDLQVKFREIPKAQADILSAGLRNNPLLFASADAIPYGNYSSQRPGANTFSATVIQPFDVGHKRTARLAVASRAKAVIQALYQDAVRLEIDNLYAAFVDVVAAREAVRYSEAGLAGINAVAKTTESLVRGSEEASTALDRVQAQREAAEIALEQSRASLLEAKQTLAMLLAIPDGAVEEIDVRGTLRETDVAVASVEELVALAVNLRPDLNAYRLGVRRAQADVVLAQREAVPDFFVLYTPYGTQNNTPLGAKDSTSWGIGGFSSIPLLNRNQGNIARTRQNVAQTRIEAEGIERRIMAEVRRAYLEYSSSKAAVERLEKSVLPKVRRVRDLKYRLLTQGQEQAMSYLDAQREYNDFIRQYRDTLIRSRRAVLKLNTVVGQRLFP